MKSKAPSKQRPARNPKLSLHGVPFNDAVRAFLKTPLPVKARVSGSNKAFWVELVVPVVRLPEFFRCINAPSSPIRATGTDLAPSDEVIGIGLDLGENQAAARCYRKELISALKPLGIRVGPVFGVGDHSLEPEKCCLVPAPKHCVVKAEPHKPNGKLSLERVLPEQKTKAPPNPDQQK